MSRGTALPFTGEGAQVLESLGFYVKSVICTGWFRLRGVRCSLILCSGQLPKLNARGQVTIGDKLIVRGRIAPCEIGAVHAASLRIGDRVFINQGAVIVAHSGIEIGDDTLIGEFSALYDTNHHAVDTVHPTKSAPVVIGSNVWLGRNVTVLPGSRIGDHTVVAAGAVVRGELPPRVLAVGNPARPVRELAAPDNWRRSGRGAELDRPEREPFSVAHVVAQYPPALGGLENAAQAIARHQHKAGIPVQVITSDQGTGNAAGEAEEFPVTRLRSFNFANTPVMPGLLFRLLRLSRQSVLHLHLAQVYTPELVRVSARLRRVPYVVHFHSDVIPSGRAGILLEPYKKLMLSRVFRDAAKVLVPTDDYRDLVCAKYRVPPGRVCVVPNGTDHRIAAAPRSGPRRGETPRLLFVGRLALQKNVPLLLRAVAAYRDRYGSQFHLTIVGEGDMRPAIEAEIRQLELGPLVTLAGARHGEALESSYAAADLLILTSVFESFGLVLVEAMTKGLPIVSVNIPAVRNVVLDGVNGLLVPSDPEALADAIHTLLTDRDLYAKISSDNLAAAHRYTWSSVVGMMSAEYGGLRRALPHQWPADPVTAQPTRSRPGRPRRLAHR